LAQQIHGDFLKVLAGTNPAISAVTLLRGGRTITTTSHPGPAQVFDYRIEEDPNATPQEKALRLSWLTENKFHVQNNFV